MKTSKSLTEAEIAELPKLPEGWKWARLGELVNDIVVGYVGPITQYLTNDLNNGVRFLSTTHIGDNQFLNHKEIRYVTNEFSGNNKKSEVLTGDIIVARHGDSGKCCIIPPYIKKAQVSNAVIIRPNNELFVNIYIIYSFGYLKRYLQKKKVDGVQQVVNTKTMEAFPFPLPPLLEQRAIVSKIEQLFSELDNGISNLKLAQEQLKVYRQAVLKKAFEGELTRKWREQQTDLPDAGNLLEQIRKEREEAAKVSGIKGKKIKPLTGTELADLPIIPKKWTWVKLDSLGDLGRGKSKHRPRNDKILFGGKYPFIQTGEVKAANYIIKSFEKTYSDVGLAQSKLWPKGTLCITIAANIAETVFLGFESCFPDSIVGFTAAENIVIKEYIYYFFKGNQSKIEAFAPATAQKNINLNTLENLIIPYCSLLEQQAIVQEIETRLSVCDKIEQDIETNLQKAEALRQSILKKAFEGKLLNEKELAEVRGEEDWEPAGVLLERIKAEKENK